uniref:Phosphoglycerate mutase-like protein n=1 Tax=Corethron hystrix TaxID=216773 RepID=A0A7S1BF52_9STRA
MTSMACPCGIFSNNGDRKYYRNAYHHAVVHGGGDPPENDISIEYTEGNRLDDTFNELTALNSGNMLQAGCDALQQTGVASIPGCDWFNDPDNSFREKKTVYLIRHAESLENVTHAAVKRSFKSLTRFEVPAQEDMDSSVRHLLDVGPKLLVNSPVSERGTHQISQLRKQLDASDFLRRSGVQVVAHSPLTRARQTCHGMLGCIAENPDCNVADGKACLPSNISVTRVHELDLLTEKTPTESVPGGRWMLDQRIVAFEEWLRDECRSEKKIAVVGHSRFFQFMLDLPYMFDNCDVWELKFDPCAVTSTFSDRLHRDNPKPIWTEMKRLFHYEENLKQVDVRMAKSLTVRIEDDRMTDLPAVVTDEEGSPTKLC